MLFSSITFIYYFLPLTILLYYITPKKLKNVILLVSSLIFYFYGEQNPALIIACVLNYVLALLIGKSNFNVKINEKPKVKNINTEKLFLIIGIILNLLLLIYYKYTNFFIDNINKILNTNTKYISVILPLGISFFTFQNISYLIDVYRKEVPPQKNIIKYATYITFFPQLIAGPIVRYQDVNDQLENRKESFENFGKGAKRFTIGLAKKVLIANTIGEMCVILSQVTNKSVLLYILQSIGYTLQIYFDFSGYSDMAIGLALFFGFYLKENFNYPLIANSITDFWRRWHISLSSFFRDYIYIPLGGNRKGILKQILNIFIVWTLTGFWHGASWNFVLWGMYFFVFLIIEKLFLKKYLKNGPISHIYTLLVVLFSFVIFNTESITDIANFAKSLVGLNNLPFANFETVYYMKNYIVILVIAIISATPLFKNLIQKFINEKDMKIDTQNNKLKNKSAIIVKNIITITEPIIYTILLMACTASLISNSFNPFIYFRF